MTRAHMRSTRLLVAASVLAVTAHAAEPVPIAVQGALIKKILAYDQTLEGKADPKVLVVVPDDAAGSGDAVVKALSGAGLTTASSRASQLADNLSGVSAVYVVGAVPAQVKELCARHSLLSISGDPAMALDGHVAVGLGTKDNGKPEIIVHLATLKAQAHRFSFALMNLARVIQ